MDSIPWNQFIDKYKDLLATLAKRKVFLITDTATGALLHEPENSEALASFATDRTAETIDRLLADDFLQTYPQPAAFDFVKTVSLFINSSLPEKERIETAYRMSRINFMGTDGIRGRVVLSVKKNFIADILADNAFTPDLVETTSFAFATILLDNGVVHEGDTIVIGNDGRDKAYDWKLNNAVINGFNRAALNVLDLGIVPTGIVPYTMLQKGYRGAAMLTASHNPANQNGIKFFIDGKKLLPEGPFGDYVLSACMFHFCYRESLPEKKGTVIKAEHVAEKGERFILSVLPGNSRELFGDTRLVLDTANGAFTEISKKVMETLDIDYTTVNEEPDGANINRSCGVAEIEGTELFEGAAYESHIPFIRELFDRGRGSAPGTVYGIALDGDGDRGFLLYYHKPDDCIHVIDGDKCGYILAEYFLKTRNIDPKKYWFISTIESDIMTAASAEKTLGLNTKVVSVGDKWIGNFDGGELLVGLEVSGHLIFPITVTSDAGKESSLLSGIGLLTGLMTLAAIKELNLPPERIIEPFEPGVSKTFYVFFVDKTKFYRNSSVWIADSELVRTEVQRLKETGTLPADIELIFEEKEDPNVLYINLVNNDGVQGCVFMRNSGTEDKTATYVKGKSALKDALYLLGQKVQDNHAALMKNERRIEYIYETFILKALKEKPEVQFNDIKQALEKETGTVIKESDWFSVVYGLKKEGRIVLEDQVLKLL